MQDKITISLYSVEAKGTFNKALFKEKENIDRIKRGFTEAALAAGRTPPEIIVSISLIPDWTKPDNGYDNLEYLRIKHEFFQEAVANFQDLEEKQEVLQEAKSVGKYGIKVQDFYLESGLTQEEKDYLHQLQAKGSNADMIKTRAIINNQNCRHLQLDSNTKIADFKSFYNNTFGAEVQNDAVNAALYDDAYVSIHNKIVYTTPESAPEGTPDKTMAKILEKHYLSHCQTCKDYSGDKRSGANSIYSKAFAPAMCELGIATRYDTPMRQWPFYRARLDSNQLRITRDVVTAINRSWSSRVHSLEEQARLQKIKMIPELTLDTVFCDFQVFAYLVKKYTTTQLPNDQHQAFLTISNTQLDKRIMVAYYKHVQEKAPQMLVELVTLIDPTRKGERLVQELFGRTLTQLKKDSQHRAEPRTEMTRNASENNPVDALITLLDNYVVERKRVQGPNPEYKRTFLCVGLGFSKTKKLNAVSALKNALMAHDVNGLRAHLSALRNGELGKTIRTFLKKTDTSSFCGENINTVSDLVDRLEHGIHQSVLQPYSSHDPKGNFPR